MTKMNNIRDMIIETTLCAMEEIKMMLMKMNHYYFYIKYFFAMRLMQFKMLIIGYRLKRELSKIDRKWKTFYKNYEN